MPNIAEKSKVFGGKGVLLSFTRDPDVFLYRELIPGTKKYRYKGIDGASPKGKQKINGSQLFI